MPDVIAFLASERAAYITGSVIRVDGGMIPASRSTQKSMPLDKKTVDTLTAVTTATLTTVLLKKGLRNVWLRTPNPCGPVNRGSSARLSLCASSPHGRTSLPPESWASPTSTRAAIECMPAGCIAVVDAMGVTDAGIFGDILCERIRFREVAGLINRRRHPRPRRVLRTNLPVWCQGTAAPASVAALTFVGWQMPIACGGVAVFPR